MRTSSALLVIDLDNFKQVNDQYGHMFGDIILSRAAKEIQNLFRANDIIARIGGDMLTLVGQRMNVSRVYIFENTPDNTHCSNTFEWCNSDATSEIQTCKISATAMIYPIMKRPNLSHRMPQSVCTAISA